MDIYAKKFRETGSGALPVRPEAASSSLVTPAIPKAPLSIHCPIH